MKNCKTCGHTISGNYNFCPNCGAKQISDRLSIRSLISNFLEKFSNLDFSFYNTSKWLLLKPDFVTLGYIQGVRKIISSPMQYALIVLSVYGLFQFLFSDFLNLILEYNFLSGFREGFNNYETSNVDRYEKINNIVNWLQSRNQFFLFTLIPYIALLSYFFYKKKGYNLAEHIVISTYAVSFTLIVNVFLGLILVPIGNETAAGIYINSSYILTIITITWVFRQSLKGSIFKPIGILILSYLFMSIFLIIALIPFIF